ncbi:hypothetical protein OIU84_027865 [Salix udensis]|uniref:Outer envelope pore protein 37, chloroplastic n=1 Tax=Salix udensis TaxID=889485 RepID=A0AAD6KBT2_9ROSI|nr:hypothetical protein OIU84_027865 [Salix udensis]
MAESPPPPPPPPSLPPNPNHMVPPIPHTDAPPSPASPISLLSKRPKLRQGRTLLNPSFAFTSKLLSIHYDLEEQNALVKTAFDLGPKFHFKASHDVKAQQGEVAMVADLGDPGYALEISSPVPSVGVGILACGLNWGLDWPRATLKFPLGEVSLGEKEEEEEVRRTLSVSGIVKSQLTYGIFTAQFNDEDLKLRYRYKDEAVSFIPSISLPSNALSFAFKRHFTPSNKLSYWYNFDSNNWSTVYKHTYGKDLKFKAGYDSDASLGWASLWVIIPIHQTFYPFAFPMTSELLVLFMFSFVFYCNLITAYLASVTIFASINMVMEPLLPLL